jgi:threonine dehydrogenase-like Zn-dependent dehydrogenase
MGTVIMLGLHANGAQISPNDIVSKQLTIRGSISHSWGTWDRTLAILREKRVDLAPIITHRLPLAEWQEGFRLAQERVGLKVILKPE